MQHFVLSIAPFAEADAQIHWSSSTGALGLESNQIVSELAKALTDGSATLGVSMFDEGSSQVGINGASKGMRLVQGGSQVLGDIISALRELIPYNIYVGSDFSDEQGNLLIWQVQRSLAEASVAFSTSDWGERAFDQIENGLKNNNLTDWIDKSLPVSVIDGAMYRSSWAGLIDCSENMIVIEV